MIALAPLLLGVSARKLVSAVGVRALRFRLARGLPPFRLTEVPPLELPQEGQEKLKVFPEGVRTIGPVAVKLNTPAAGVTGVPFASRPSTVPPLLLAQIFGMTIG